MSYATSKIKVVLVFVSLLAAVLTVAPGQAQAKDGPGTSAVRGANDTIRALLAKKVPEGSDKEKALATQVTEKVRGFLNVEELGRLALTDHLADLSEEQIASFTKLLRELIEQNYIKGLRANLKYEVKYLGEERAAKGDTIEVHTEIETTRKGRPYTVAIDYLLRKDGKNLRAYDVVTDGVGLVKNYRSQFNRIIAKEGFDGLLARMQRVYDQKQKKQTKQ